MPTWILKLTLLIHKTVHWAKPYYMLPHPFQWCRRRPLLLVTNLDCTFVNGAGSAVDWVDIEEVLVLVQAHLHVLPNYVLVVCTGWVLVLTERQQVGNESREPEMALLEGSFSNLLTFVKVGTLG